KRQARALAAAQIERSVREELLKRLESGTYDDIYNYHESAYTQAVEATGDDEMEADAAERQAQAYDIEDMMEAELETEPQEADLAQN
ncbi:Mak16 protein, partial [Kipferlia bialata]